MSDPFLDSLVNVINKFDPNLDVPNATPTDPDPVLDALVADYNASHPGFVLPTNPPSVASLTGDPQTDLTWALQKVFSSATPPTTLQGFIDALRAAIGSNLTSSMGQAFTAIENEFEYETGMSQGDTTYNPLSSQTMLNDSFTNFLADFVANNFVADPNVSVNGAQTPTPGTTTLANFIQDWRKYMTTTAFISITGTGPFSGIPNYLDVFKQYFPSATTAQFQNLMQAFVQQMINEHGYFLPSHHYDEFLLTLKTLKNAANLSSINGTDSAKVLVLNKVFKLLIAMIGIIQNSAVAQANRLNFYTAWQQSYTKTAANVPTFIANDGSIYGGNHPEDDTLRGQLNARSQAWAQSLNSFGGLVGDQAKTLQSNINQSNQAVNQQANLATAILQQMSTILQAIFR